MEKVRRGIRFPTYSLTEAERVARIVQEKGGGVLSISATAVALGLSPTSSSLVGRIACAKHFGYIEESNDVLRTTQLAKKILLPTSSESSAQGRREAFLGFPVFKQIVERFDNARLPDKPLLENLLVIEYGVSDVSKGLAYQVFVDSGKFAGQIFETDGGLMCGTHEAPRSSEGKHESSAVDQGHLDPKMIELLQHVGSLKLAIGLLGRQHDDIEKEIEAVAHEILGRTVELADELHLPSIKMSAKIALDRVKSDGLKGAEHFVSFIHEGMREDLGIAKEH